MNGDIYVTVGEVDPLVQQELLIAIRDGAVATFNPHSKEGNDHKGAFMQVPTGEYRTDFEGRDNQVFESALMRQLVRRVDYEKFAASFGFNVVAPKQTDDTLQGKSLTSHQKVIVTLVEMLGETNPKFKYNSKGDDNKLTGQTMGIATESEILGIKVNHNTARDIVQASYKANEPKPKDKKQPTTPQRRVQKAGTKPK